MNHAETNLVEEFSFLCKQTYEKKNALDLRKNIV